MDGRDYVIIALIVGVVVLVALGGNANGKQTAFTKLPESLYCQPFKAKKVMDYEEGLLKAQGFEPVNLMDVPLAFKAQSDGKGELITITTATCMEKIGHRDTIRASTYYYRKIK